MFFLLKAHGEDFLHLLADDRICSFVLMMNRSLSWQRLLGTNILLLS